jgi:hypothetical protein
MIYYDIVFDWVFASATIDSQCKMIVPRVCPHDLLILPQCGQVIQAEDLESCSLELQGVIHVFPQR